MVTTLVASAPEPRDRPGLSTGPGTGAGRCGSPAGGLHAVEVARVRSALTARHDVDDDALIPELSDRWFVVVDVLNGVDVPPSALAAALYDMGDVLRYSRSLLPHNTVDEQW